MAALRFGLLLVCVLPPLSACSDAGGATDVVPTLRFADRTDVEIARFINAAGGTEMFLAQALMDDYDDSGFDTDPCPARSVSGQTATITGNCTRTDGTMLGGMIQIDNPLGWDAIDYDFADGVHYTAIGWTVTDDGNTQIIDGTMTRSDQLTTWDADLTVTIGGVALRSDLYYHCSNPSAPRCSLTNSGLELVGVGGALASGTVSIDRDTNRTNGSYTLRGADRLEVVMRDGCVGWSIEGTTRGQTCP